MVLTKPDIPPKTIYTLLHDLVDRASFMDEVEKREYHEVISLAEQVHMFGTMASQIQVERAENEQR